MALTRVKGALWIPNTERPGWDASDPERHTEMMTDPQEPRRLRVTRARIIRLAKAWNEQYAKPGLSSFNITALALESITEEMTVLTGLSEFFDHSATELGQGRLTKDPAGVSGSIKLKHDRAVVADRLKAAAGHMGDAVTNEDDEFKARDALASIFTKYLEPPSESDSKARMAWDARKSSVGWTSGGLVTSDRATTPQKPVRGYGSEPR